MVRTDARGLEITTFHAFGYRLLREHGVQVREVPETEKLVSDLFEQLIQSNQRLEQLFIEYLCNYLQDELQEVDFQTQEDYYQYIRAQRYQTLSGIQVKSLAEKEITNFFFMHGIACKYERQVPWLAQRYRPDFYLPEYDITIEHWGLDRQGRTAPWIDAQRYHRTRLWKLAQFREHGKILVETWEYERTEGTLIVHLKQSLQRVCPSLQFQPLSYTDLVHQVYKQEFDRRREIKKLIATLITHAKSHGLSAQQLEQRLRAFSGKQKTRHFAEMALMVYQEYEHVLKQNQWMDFNDMINQAIDLIRAKPERYAQRYEHILIDEFQDISHQRLTLIQCLVNERTTTKLFCVGDDWQSIYQFAGSEVALFVDFEASFAQPAVNVLSTNYRSAPKIVEASHVFLLSVISGVFGFPSEMHDASVLEIIKPPRTSSTIFEEERRLFYVALTRSKERVYIYTQKGAESLFLHEIASSCESQSI